MAKGLGKIQNIPLRDMLNLPDFKDLADSFTRLTSIPTAILGLKGEILIDSGWHNIR